MYKVVFIASCLALAFRGACGQHQQYTTPVPILKQINKHNSDGSYTYGYEAADKSFKIETKYPTGEVYGKYGYVDDQGQVREIEYGASKRGFEPAGSDINVPPPTLTASKSTPLGPNEIDDGQYREDPAEYYKGQNFNRPVAASKFSLNNYQQPRPQPTYNPAPAPYSPAPAPYNPAPAPYNPAPAPYRPPTPQYYNPPSPPQPSYYQPQPPRPQYNPYNPNSHPSHFHPAVKSLDIWSGSYSLDYTGRK
ncbi:cuticular protein 97Eb [Musca autumnalis]|uniref:cuticular protein 97Eb n=1 Tax=Musca autumnalis TaxID=221902 RepID=UPI003CF440A5